MNQEQIEKYVAGTLGEAEAEAFETYCIAHPEFAKQVEFEQRLRAGITEIARGSTAEFVRANNPFAYRFAVAASVLIVVAAGFYGWRNWGGGTMQPILTAVASDSPHEGPALRLAQVRGAADSSTVQDDTVRVEIVGLFDSEYHYSIELARLSAKHAENVATLYSQHPASPVTLEVMLHGERLRPGTYLLRVRKQSTDEEPLEFDFVKN